VPTLIACFIAGICVAGFITLWFKTAHQELSAKHSSLTDLESQLHLHEQLAAQVRAGPDAQAAANMLETSRMLCREAAKGYNRVLRKPMNRIPALLMGYRAADELGSN
jgi:Tfp pilus assembly protein PilV